MRSTNILFQGVYSARLAGSLTYRFIDHFLISSFFFLLLSLGLSSVTPEHAHYWVVWFQPHNSGYGVTRLCIFLLRIMCYVFPSTDGSGPPLSPASEIPPHRVPCLQPICPRVYISHLLLPPLRPFVVYLPSPPVAPVVTPRPTVRLTGGRCHAALGVLSRVPMFEGLPSRPVRLVELGLGVGGGT